MYAKSEQFTFELLMQLSPAGLSISVFAAQLGYQLVAQYATNTVPDMPHSDGTRVVDTSKIQELSSLSAETLI